MGEVTLFTQCFSKLPLQGSFFSHLPILLGASVVRMAGDADFLGCVQVLSLHRLGLFSGVLHKLTVLITAVQLIRRDRLLLLESRPWLDSMAAELACAPKHTVNATLLVCFCFVFILSTLRWLTDLDFLLFWLSVVLINIYKYELTTHKNCNKYILLHVYKNVNIPYM